MAFPGRTASWSWQYHVRPIKTKCRPQSLTGSRCSYNRVNNSYGCQNSKALNGLLKTELGFQGWVVTDWNAQHAGVAAALAGLDVAMPNGRGFWGDNFTTAFTNGSVEVSRLDDMTTR